MLFTGRTKKQTTRRAGDSGSKDSKKSNISKNKQKILSISANQLKLREAINTKFEKSKIKNFKYIKIKQEQSKSKSKQEGSSSDDSDQVTQFSCLIGQRFVNLKEYHQTSLIDHQNKKFLIRMRNSDNKKTITTEQDPNNTSSKFLIETINSIQKIDINQMFFAKQKGFGRISVDQRRTLSGGKKESEWKKLGFDSHSASKNFSAHPKRTPSQQQQPKSRLYYLRKQKHSPLKTKYF